jgi:hypothetical protein
MNSLRTHQISFCRYRIDGAVLRAAVDLGSVNLPVESALSSGVDFESQRPTEDEKSTKTPPPVDVGEILRRWTHALQAVHKQTLRLVRIAIYVIFEFIVLY